MIYILSISLRTLNYGIMVYSLLWVVQDLYHQLFHPKQYSESALHLEDVGSGVED